MHATPLNASRTAQRPMCRRDLLYFVPPAERGRGHRSAMSLPTPPPDTFNRTGVCLSLAPERSSLRPAHQ